MTRSEMLKMIETSCHDGKSSHAADIFNAALAGICANPNFFGPLFQQSPQAAVNFAADVTIAAMFSRDENQ